MIEERAGRLAYAAGVAGMGALRLWAGSLGAVFLAVPRWVPLRHALGYASGVLLVACAAALLAPRTRRLAAIVLAANFLVWLVLLRLPQTLAEPMAVGSWEACGLNMTVVAGAWILLARSGEPRSDGAARLSGERGARLARRLFALGVPLVGLAHFLTPDAIVFVPAWLPLRIGWVYLTGAAHIAAGLAILLGVVPRLAAVLEALQISSFVILSHLPAVVEAPKDRVQWAMLVYALAIAGAAWLVAATYGEVSAGRPDRSPRSRTPGQSPSASAAEASGSVHDGAQDQRTSQVQRIPGHGVVESA